MPTIFFNSDIQKTLFYCIREELNRISNFTSVTEAELSKIKELLNNPNNCDILDDMPLYHCNQLLTAILLTPLKCSEFCLSKLKKIEQLYAQSPGLAPSGVFLKSFSFA